MAQQCQHVSGWGIQVDAAMLPANRLQHRSTSTVVLARHNNSNRRTCIMLKSRS